MSECVCRLLAKAGDADDKSSSGSKKSLEARAELFGQLGWTHWQRYELSRVKLLFPKNYPLF